MIIETPTIDSFIDSLVLLSSQWYERYTHKKIEPDKMLYYSYWNRTLLHVDTTNKQVSINKKHTPPYWVSLFNYTKEPMELIWNKLITTKVVKEERDLEDLSKKELIELIKELNNKNKSSLWTIGTIWKSIPLWSTDTFKIYPSPFIYNPSSFKNLLYKEYMQCLVKWE